MSRFLQVMGTQVQEANLSRHHRMARAIALPGCVIVCMLAASADFSDVQAEETMPCLGVASWNAAHAEQLPESVTLRDRARRLTAPDLLRELQQRADADQRARKAWLTAPLNRSAAVEVSETDAANLTWLKRLVKEHGVPTAEQVGEAGVHLVWLLAQHADRDPKFQESILPTLAQRFAAGELPANDLARLADRVQVARGKPQLYGTQFDWTSGQFDPKNLGDVTEIDGRRSELGLMPFSDYACMMNSYRHRAK